MSRASAATANAVPQGVPGAVDQVTAPPASSRLLPQDHHYSNLQPHLDSGAKDVQHAILSDPQPVHALDDDDDEDDRDEVHDHDTHDSAAAVPAHSSVPQQSPSDHVQITVNQAKRPPTSAATSDKHDTGSTSSTQSSEQGRESDEKTDDSAAKTKRSKKKKSKKVADDGTVDRVGFKDLYRYATIWDHIFNFIGLVAAAAAGAVQPLMTIVFGSLTTAFLEYTNALLFDGDIPAARDHLDREIVHGVLFLVYIGVAMLVATYIYMAAWVYTGQVITRRIREKYLQAILRQDIAYFDVVGAGEITTRIQSDIQLIQEGISDKIPMSVMFISAFVTGFIVAYVKSWELALALSSMIPCIIIAGALMNAVTAKLQQAELDRVSRAASIAEESLATLRTAKAFGIEDNLVELYDESNREATRFGIKRSLFQGIGMGVFFFVIYSGYALAFYFGAKLLASGRIASGTVMNVILSILIGAFSMAMMAPNMQALSYAFAAGSKVFETIDRVPPIDSSDPSGLRPDHCEGKLEFKDIDFSYPARPDVPVLDAFSLEVPAGKVTALVGASGSGKSTIVSLVERFYDPDGGAAYLDGVELRDLNLKWLRTQIGLVSQEPTLFSTSIRANIAHGLINTPYQQLSDEEKETLITDAAKMANAHGFISQLPNGYDTMVGERGFLLSGGQKQRIAIARAIVKNPRILLLDEATSALDTQSEAVVQDALEQASQNRTTITIAHRLSTIKNADKIVVMGKGVIIESGKHDELLELNGAYAQLVDAQKIRAKVSTNLNEETTDDEPLTRFIPSNAKVPLATSDTEKAALREEAKAEMPAGLEKSATRGSVASAILAQRQRDQDAKDKENEKIPSIFYLLYRLAKINRDHVLSLYLPGVIASICSGAAYPCFSILFGHALQNFSLCSSINGGPCPEPARSIMLRDANHWALYFFVIAILCTLAISIQTYTLMKASSVLMERIRRMSLFAYLRADVSYHDEDAHSSGSLSNSLADNSQKINGLVGVTLGTIIQSISTLVTGAIIALANGWKLSLVVIACIPLTLSAGFVRLQLVVLKDARIKKAYEGSAARACEAAGSMRVVASLTREEDCLEIYRRELDAPSQISRNTAFYGNFLYAISQALQFWIIGLGFWYGSHLLIAGEYTSGQYFTILTAVVFGSIQASNAFSFVPDISNAKTAAWDSIKLLDMVPEIDVTSDEGTVLEHVEGHLRLENVHFRYPTRPTVRVLRGLDVDVKPGTYVALVGASGCGKSTTIQLIQRFYDTLSGRVTIDGHDISTLNLREVRKHMALVSQEPTLYDGSIEFNIRLGAYEDADSVSMDDLRAAAASANILAFIEGLPDKWDTQVGGKGTQLSGGQKQRIAIARALIRNPRILLLDEATSALDSDSEKIVQEALDKAAAGRTTIAIAHRLSTISRADMIYCLKDGKVVEKGEHAELLRLNGIYADLVRMQELQKDE
ncbi:ABC transporter, transmembrane domain protein [Kalmanozyma brasiliensis GHG001]|uniref:Multidrug resistance protein n=1 Tax=Kalmanozyma brasiliensis (strain GHG001) TaxID=1365824 RepID=V5GMV1_KALBG|nr:ABC transporter, transmembrane domain protein [Kalmanozyma brasiliensis GHG001]EST07302.1 ABC transporter, transmembrane domain protein [Kalmanozyma brasiliensis GHG001]